METLFDKQTVEKCIKRIESLSLTSKSKWGKMNAAEMLDHCSKTMEIARNQRHIKRIFLSYILGQFIKKKFFDQSDTPKNSPTHSSFISHVETETIDKYKLVLIGHLNAFCEGGENACTNQAHAFFGKLSKQQWGMGMYKHLDHHLQQFGV
ncbi:MAG: DUF1569 domain-containing protein [Moraxellaceae bacterium]